MKTVDKVFEVLKVEGLVPEKESYGIGFKYQMTNFAYMEDEKDETFFNMLVPYIYETNEENEIEVLRAINKVNNTMKVVKLVLSDNNVWVCFENLIDENTDLRNIVGVAVNTLYQARQNFYEALKNE